MNVSASDAHLSNSTDDPLWAEIGAVICVNSSHIKVSEFSVLPSTTPARAGTATATIGVETALAVDFGVSVLQLVRTRAAHTATTTITLRLNIIPSARRLGAFVFASRAIATASSSRVNRVNHFYVF